MMTEAQVLANCMHNSDDVLERVFFPQFQHEFDVKSGVKQVGYHTPLVHIQPLDFEGWKRLRYKQFREARYASLQEQQDMQYHDLVEGTTKWRDHIESVKLKYPKPEDV